MRWLVPLLGWLALLGGVAFVATGRSRAPRGTEEVSTLLAYPLDADVRFTLEAGEAEVKLVTWLERPEGPPDDPRVAWPWCLEAVVEDPAGAVVRTWQVWSAARPGWAEDEDGRRRPTAWRTEGAGRLSADRVVRLDLAGLVPGGGTLRVRPSSVPPGARPLAIAFRRGERSAVARFRLERGDREEERVETLAELGAPEWSALPEAWRRNLSRHVWERLGALPPGGGVVPTVRIASTWRETAWAEVPAHGVLVPPGGAAAFNLEGRVAFEADWALPDGTPSVPVGAEARIVRADGSVERLALPPAARIGPWTFDEPVASVQIALDPGLGARLLRARVRPAGGDGVWGDPPRLTAEDGAGGDASAGGEANAGAGAAVRLGPDLRSVELFRTGATPLRFPVATGEVVRLHLRPRLAPGPLPGLGAPAPEEPRTVRLRVVDAAGAPLAAWEVALSPVPSAFERYTQGDDLASARVAEPETRTLVPPEGAAFVEVEADAPVDAMIRVAAAAEFAQVEEPGYALPADASVDTVFVPQARDRWEARAPEGVEALAREGRTIRIDGQVRLLPAGPPAAPAGGGAAGEGAQAAGAGAGPARAWDSLPLPGPFDLVAQPTVRNVGVAGARVRLGATPVPVVVGAAGRLGIDYRVPPERVGEPVSVDVAGVVSVHRPLTAAGTLEIGDLPPGPVSVAVGAEGLFLARSEGEPAWRVRRAWRLEPGEVATLHLPGGPGAVALHAYVPSGERAWLAWTLDDVAASAPGLYAQLTDRAGFVPLRVGAGETLPLSWEGEPLRAAAPVRVRLGDDVGARPGRLRVSIEGARGPVWIRAASTWPGPDEDEGERHWLKGAPP